jgi:hypothetical protein
VIAAILLADAPRAPDHTPDGAADPRAVCDRPAAGALHRDPPPAAPSAPTAGGSAGTLHRTPLRHVIGL